MKYYKRFREGSSLTVKITKRKAIDILSRYYVNPAQVLSSAPPEHKIRTPFSYVWKEK